MNNQAFDILEFGSLRGLVRRSAQTELGRMLVAQLAPVDTLEELQTGLLRLKEAIQLRQRATRFSFEGVVDPAEAIARLKIAGTALEPLILLDLGRLCDRALDARARIQAERETCPSLFQIVELLPAELRKLSANLSR